MQINILKKALCGKVSSTEKETLTYNIGNIDGEYRFRITDNVSGGYLSHEWRNLNVFGMGLSQKVYATICCHFYR